MHSLAAFAIALLACTAYVQACDDVHGMHCLNGRWECPGDLFDKAGRGITETFCANKCCLCLKKTGAARCTPDDLLPNKEIFINPNFIGFPRPGTCQWCPKGTEKKEYTHKCFDQRSVGFENQLNECNTYPIVPGFILPNGVGNVPPAQINTAEIFKNFQKVTLAQQGA